MNAVHNYIVFRIHVLLGGPCHSSCDNMALHIQECSRLAQKLSEYETQQGQELTRRQEQLIQVAHIAMR